MRRNATILIAAILALGLALSGSAGARTTAGLNIYAAASLTEVFKAYDGTEQYNFAGSNVLETQIRNGAPADIFLSADTKNPQAEAIRRICQVFKAEAASGIGKR